MAKNINYRKFLDDGIIKFLNTDDIANALKNVKGRHIKSGRALIICFYYTGARPIEILRMRAKDINKDKSYFKINLTPSKRGLTREIHISQKRKFMKELYDYSMSLPPEMLMFYHYKTKYIRTRQTKKGLKTYVEETDGLRYHFYKWFSNVIDGSISPYYLRHNRFSKMSRNGATMDQIKFYKGSRTYDSIYPYLHLSSEMAKKASKTID